MKNGSIKYSLFTSQIRREEFKAASYNRPVRTVEVKKIKMEKPKI